MTLIFENLHEFREHSKKPQWWNWFMKKKAWSRKSRVRLFLMMDLTLGVSVVEPEPEPEP